MALLKRYFPDRIDSPILYEITAEFVQQMVEPNLGRRLIEKEIERMHHSLLDSYHENELLADLILGCARDAMDNSNDRWLEVDEDYEKRKPLYKLGDYQIGEDEIEK